MRARLKTFFMKGHYGIVLSSYIIICILIFIAGITNIRGMISDYNEEQVRMVTGLLVEKVNAELDNLVVQVEHVANIVLTDGETKKGKLLTLDRYRTESEFDSVGFIDSKFEFHGDVNDRADLAQLGISRQWLNSEEILISDPYRSSVTGKYVMTIFVPVFIDDFKVGMLYANLDLAKIADFVNDSGIDLPAMAYMVNAKSLNYITCTERNGVPAGNWNNLMLRREDIEFKDKNGYGDFLNAMNNNESEGTLRFEIDNTEYTLGYSSINKMPGWYIALELGNDDLSDTFNRFRSNIYQYVLVLIVVTLVYLAYIFSRELLQKKEFQTLSTMDPMTGILNKRSFVQLVEKYIDAESGKETGALIFVDVDDFKRYNDEYGHINGDVVLKTFAGNLSAEFGSKGYVGRYGGDEFVVFLRNTNDKAAINKQITRIREKLSDIALEGFGLVPVTFSAGGALYPADGVTFEELCNSADKALYQVKESGKAKFYWS